MPTIEMTIDPRHPVLLEKKANMLATTPGTRLAQICVGCTGTTAKRSSFRWRPHPVGTMANDPNPVVVKITSIADTSGVEEIQDGLKGVGEESNSATEYFEKLAEARKKDAESAKKQVVANESVAASSKMSGVAFNASMAGIGAAAGFALNELQRIAEGLKTIDSTNLKNLDASLATNVESFQKWAKAASSPLSALADFFRGGESIEETFSALNQQLDLSAKQREAYIDRLISKNITQTEQVTTMVQRLTEANQLLNATSTANSAAGKRGDAQAIASGADAEVVGAKRVASDTTASVDEMNRSLDELRLSADTAAKNASEAAANLTKITSENVGRDALEKASKSAEDLQNTANELATRVEAQEKILAERVRGVVENASATIESIGTNSGAPITEATNKAIEIIKAKAEEQGGQLSGLTSSILERLTKIVSDNIPDAKQAQELEVALTQLRTTSEAQGTATFQAVTGLLDVTKAFEKKFQDVLQEIGNMKQRMLGMQQR